MPITLQLDDASYEAIVEEVTKRVYRHIYGNQPKEKGLPRWMSLKDFREQLPVVKDAEWIRMFILHRPEMKDWVINLDRGRGYKILIAPEALTWCREHVQDIDWEVKLPK